MVEVEPWMALLLYAPNDYRCVRSTDCIFMMLLWRKYIGTEVKSTFGYYMILFNKKKGPVCHLALGTSGDRTQHPARRVHPATLLWRGGTRDGSPGMRVRPCLLRESTSEETTLDGSVWRRRMWREEGAKDLAYWCLPLHLVNEILNGGGRCGPDLFHKATQNTFLPTKRNQRVKFNDKRT
jgi:hypothetical protein